MICLDYFRDVERLYPPRSLRLSSLKASFGLENKKIIKKLLILECQNFYAKLRNFYYRMPTLVSYTRWLDLNFMSIYIPNNLTGFFLSSMLIGNPLKRWKWRSLVGPFWINEHSITCKPFDHSTGISIQTGTHYL